jgi:glycosyltransferase involved in cell wall biosynthesis
MTDVSVVMPAWNAERFIGEAVASALAQSRPVLEVVVADDGSTDDTASIAEALGATVLRRSHEGLGATRNAAIAASRGELVAFLDADDVWLPEKLERQVAALHDDPELGAVSCLVDEFLDLRPGEHPPVRPPRLGEGGALCSATVVRRTVVDALGPFQPRGSGDWVEWWARARRLGVHEHVIDQVLVRRRIHGDNNSSREFDQRALLDIVRAHRRGTRSS